MEKGVASFQERQGTERRGMPVIKKYFLSLSQTQSFLDVEIEQQIELDIDFTWTHDDIEEWVEVKIDTQGHKTGNFAFETVSNELKGTPGCFMRSKAHILVYFFVETNEMYIIKLPYIRDWFIRELSSRPNRFRPFKTHTSVNGSFYPSYGRLVPVAEVIKLNHVRKIDLN